MSWVTERKTARLEWFTARRNLFVATITVVAAALGLATAILTLVAQNLNNDVGSRDVTIGKLNSQNNQLRAQLKTANESLSTRLDEISDLTAENAKLRGSMPAALAQEDLTTARMAAQVRLATGGDTLDLNSTLQNFKPKSQWVWSDTVSYDRGTLDFADVSMVSLGETKANHATCAAATGWSKKSEIDAQALTAGTTCLRLASGRYVSIVVDSYDEAVATLSITVWDE